MTLKALYYVYNLLLAAWGGFLVGALLLPQGMSVAFCAWMLGGVLACQLLKEVTGLVAQIIRQAADRMG